MANIMTKRGSQDNVITYEHICDTAADIANIEPRYVTLGSVCIVLEGTSGSLEVYMANSNKQWISITEIAGNSGSDSLNTELVERIIILEDKMADIESILNIPVATMVEAENGRPITDESNNVIEFDS